MTNRDIGSASCSKRSTSSESQRRRQRRGQPHPQEVDRSSKRTADCLWNTSGRSQKQSNARLHSLTAELVGPRDGPGCLYDLASGTRPAGDGRGPSRRKRWCTQTLDCVGSVELRGITGPRAAARARSCSARAGTWQRQDDRRCRLHDHPHDDRQAGRGTDLRAHLRTSSVVGDCAETDQVLAGILRLASPTRRRPSAITSCCSLARSASAP